ncbi:MAG TPA: hypothetical protein PK402_09180 [Tepidisphaeraceae bacterium]|nr:hypothetical protein [Tepidisphaeraceae bacterium]
MIIRRGVKSIERSINEQQKFAESFIKNAQRAKKVGDDQQYNFIREQLKKTTSIKRMLERQLVAVNSAMIIQKQAAASGQFAESMGVIAEEIQKTFGELDLTKTQVQWEKAVTQSQSIEERMGLFLDSMETGMGQGSVAPTSSAVSDDEIDRMIEADVLAQETSELGKLDQLESEIEKELARSRTKD